MLLKTSQDSIKSALEYLVRLPFTKHILHKISEVARGKCVAFFSLHRVIEDTAINLNHPHFANKTALIPRKARKLLSSIHERLPFISMADAISYLKGERKLTQSHAVLLIEVPYVQTIRLLSPILEDHKIPATVVLNSECIHDGQMPWMDEIIYRLGSTKKNEIAVNFIDRSFSLATMHDRMAAAHHFIDYLSHSNPTMLRARIAQLRELLWEVAVHPVGERICTVHHLEKLAKNPLFSFACAGAHRLPFFDISHEDAQKEIIDSKYDLHAMFGDAMQPVFYYPLGSDKRRHKELIAMMMESGYEAAIGPLYGVCRPGDNMFRLMRLPLAFGSKSFAQFELQGLSDAIDEFLLVSFAKEKEL